MSARAMNFTVRNRISEDNLPPKVLKKIENRPYTRALFAAVDAQRSPFNYYCAWARGAVIGSRIIFSR